jgi:hypothetical protein
VITENRFSVIYRCTINDFTYEGSVERKKRQSRVRGKYTGELPQQRIIWSTELIILRLTSTELEYRTQLRH